MRFYYRTWPWLRSSGRPGRTDERPPLRVRRWLREPVSHPPRSNPQAKWLGISKRTASYDAALARKVQKNGNLLAGARQSPPVPIRDDEWIEPSPTPDKVYRAERSRETAR